MNGSESRLGLHPEVLVDGRAVGHVDTQIHVWPGNHRIRVRHGWIKTREYPHAFNAGRLVVLDYDSHGANGILETAVLVFEVFLFQALKALLQPSTPASWALFATVILAASAAAIALLYLWVIPTFVPPLQVYRPAADADAAHILEAPTQHAANAQQLCSGRMVVDLIVPAVRGVQPPRPKVVVDGKKLGAVGQIFRLRAGKHRVRLKGWLDRSTELEIMVPAGGLVEIETEQTNLGVTAMLVIGGVAAAMFLSVLCFQMFDERGELLFFEVVAVGCAVGILLSRFGPTMQLRLKN